MCATDYHRPPLKCSKAISGMGSERIIQYSSSGSQTVIFITGTYIETENHSYSDFYSNDFLKLNIFLFPFSWFSKPEYHTYSYFVEVWRQNSKHFTQSPDFKCSVVIKGTERRLSMQFSLFYVYVLMFYFFDKFFIHIQYYLYSYL